MRILVAGDRGYIGAVLVPFLRAAGHEVDGLDLGLYEGCDLFPLPAESGPRAARDMRDVQPGELAGYDAVMCLAALSNDPLGRPEPGDDLLGQPGGDAEPGPRRQAGRRRAVPVRLIVQPVRRGRLGRGGRGRGAVPGHPYGETKVVAERELSAAGRRRLQPDLPAQRDRLRRLAPAAPGHRRQQPHRGGDDDRRGAAAERRVAVAAAGAHRGHQPGIPGRRPGPARARARPGVQRRPLGGQRADPRGGRAGPRRGARLGAVVRRGRRAGPAQLPGRLRQARRHLSGSEAALDGR